MAKTKIISTAPGGLDYSKCKRTELDTFYKQRLHKDVPKGVNKPELIQMLRRQDQDPGTFRFLDLPAEMRNAVYKELLILPRPGSRRRGSTYQPAVLGLCRQVHSESPGILYGENEPEIIIEVAHHTAHSYPRELQRHCTIPLFSKITHKDCHQFYPWSDASRSLRLEQLTRFHSSSVQINIGNQQVGSGLSSSCASELLIAVNQLLYSLCDFLASSPQKRTITSKLNAQTDLVTTQELHQTLWPVTRLGSATTINFVNVPQKVQQLLLAGCVTAGASPSLLEKLSQAEPRAKAISKEIRKLGSEKQAQIQSEIRAWYNTTYDINVALKRTQMMDKTTEKTLRQRIRTFEKTPAGKLADLLAANIGERIKDMENIRADVESKRGHA
ncbi:uncharacterized protein CLAFUR5_09004 [Fulvia fulva]|uniref:Uncharacterized protein n=1 Tax=Passalora fulva TaxID=5499 RepID=A0A9Q8UTC2_PASFU|nr:uncharacterized protein CLAFUR5_09004 [Fulvia fulva]UJO21774.1 hypothetical protein CLAFUR5_09004 [Fulvia fulva]